MSRRSRHRGALAAILAAALAIAGATVPSHAAAQDVRPAPVGDREARAATNLAIRRDLKQVNAAMATTFNRGDYLGAARFYTDDAQIIGAGDVRVTGRAAIDRYWTSIPAGAKWTLEVLEVGGSLLSPWQLGRSTLVVPSRNGGGTQTSVVDFVAIWKRQPDRSLKLYIDMYVPAPRRPAER